MKTTEMVLEHLIGGALAVAAALYVLWTLVPSQIEYFFKLWREGIAPVFGDTLLVAVAAGSAYASGIVLEFAARNLFEPWLRAIKVRRFADFRKDWEHLLRRVPPIALSLDRLPPRELAYFFFGLTRFSLKHNGLDLSREVESQLTRMRLVRMLAIIIWPVFLGVAAQFVRAVTSRNWSACIVLAALAPIGYKLNLNIRKAIRDRFEMYCRAIERSFIILTDWNGSMPLAMPPEALRHGTE